MPIRFIGFALLPFLFICLVCNAASLSANSALDNAYEQLYLARFGLDYPPRADVLKTCQEKHIPECLRSYHPVQEAKRYVGHAIAQDKTAVFTHVTNTIERDCAVADTQKEKQTNFRCYGAIIALYFFSNADDDNKIQQFLARASAPIIQSMLGSRFEWFYNRPNVDQWIAVISALPTDKLPDNEKQATLRFFREAKQPFEKFGVML